MMAPKPFPLPLTVGTDICQISRVFRILASPRGGRFVDRVLTPGERAASAALRAGGTRTAVALSEAEVRDGAWEALKRAEPEMWKRAQFMAGR